MKSIQNVIGYYYFLKMFDVSLSKKTPYIYKALIPANNNTYACQMLQGFMNIPTELFFELIDTYSHTISISYSSFSISGEAHPIFRVSVHLLTIQRNSIQTLFRFGVVYASYMHTFLVVLNLLEVLRHIPSIRFYSWITMNIFARCEANIQVIVM